jgi:hypothetical protein
MKKLTILSSVLALFLLLGCATTASKPNKTSLELQAIQAKQFDTTKSVAFASVLSVFQDFGYVVNSAEIDTGFITAKSPTKGGFMLFVGQIMEDTKATAFIEELRPNKTNIRLNFVKSKETSSGYGMKSAHDTAIENPTVYQNAFAKIQEAIFIRTAQ